MEPDDNIPDSPSKNHNQKKISGQISRCQQLTSKRCLFISNILIVIVIFIWLLVLTIIITKSNSTGNQTGEEFPKSLQQTDKTRVEQCNIKQFLDLEKNLEELNQKLKDLSQQVNEASMREEEKTKITEERIQSLNTSIHNLSQQFNETNMREEEKTKITEDRIQSLNTSIHNLSKQINETNMRDEEKTKITEERIQSLNTSMHKLNEANMRDKEKAETMEDRIQSLNTSLHNLSKQVNETNMRDEEKTKITEERIQSLNTSVHNLSRELNEANTRDKEKAETMEDRIQSLNTSLHNQTVNYNKDRSDNKEFMRTKDLQMNHLNSSLLGMVNNLTYLSSTLRGMASESLMHAQMSQNKATDAFNIATWIDSQMVQLNRTDNMFSVYLTSSFAYPNNGDIIKFSGININNGGHYKAITGKFECPTTGMYFFTFSAYSAGITISKGISGQHFNRLSLRMLLNGNTIATADCSNDNPNDISVQCGNGVIIKCNRGDNVWIQAVGTHNQLYGQESRKDSTFTGFLVRIV